MPRSTSGSAQPLQPTDSSASMQMARAMLLRDGVSELAGWMDPDIVVWSPTMSVVGRDAALLALDHDDGFRDTLTDVLFTIEHVDLAPSRVYLEWQLVGRFTNPCFVDDDLMIDPTDEPIELSGVTVTTIGESGATSVRCYYDDLAALEQLIAVR